MSNIAQDWMTFHKASVSNTMKTIELVQHQNEEVVRTMLAYSFFPQTGKKVINDWLQVFQTSRNECMKAVETCLSELEGMFLPADTEKSQDTPAKSQKKTKSAPSSQGKSQEKGTTAEKNSEASKPQTNASSANKATEVQQAAATEKTSNKSSSKESAPVAP
jgi:cobalamin biosynthesis Mg chelatase CobN